MTRAERIEAAAKALTEKARKSSRIGLEIHYLEVALALPPDPVPRRLTEDDMHMCELLRLHTHQEDADFLNARIFGGAE